MLPVLIFWGKKLNNLKFKDAVQKNKPIVFAVNNSKEKFGDCYVRKIYLLSSKS